MKAIQISIDEVLLKELDADMEVKRDGRSAVFRRAIMAYLHDKRTKEIREQYRQAYGGKPGLGNDFEGWEEQGSWPEK